MEYRANSDAPSSMGFPNNRPLARRTPVLIIGDALIAWISFLLGAMLALGRDSYIEDLHNQSGFYKICGFTVLVLVCSYQFGLYRASTNQNRDICFRLCFAMGTVDFILFASLQVWPGLHGFPLIEGVIILPVALIGWRCAFIWLANHRAGGSLG